VIETNPNSSFYMFIFLLSHFIISPFLNSRHGYYDVYNLRLTTLLSGFETKNEIKKVDLIHKSNKPSTYL